MLPARVFDKAPGSADRRWSRVASWSAPPPRRPDHIRSLDAQLPLVAPGLAEIAAIQALELQRITYGFPTISKFFQGFLKILGS